MELAGDSRSWGHGGGTVEGGERRENSRVVGRGEGWRVSVERSLLTASQMSVPGGFQVVLDVVAVLSCSDLRGVSRANRKEWGQRGVGVGVGKEHSLTPLPGQDYGAWVVDHRVDDRSGYGSVGVNGNVSSGYAEAESVRNIVSALYQTVSVHVGEGSMGDTSSAGLLLGGWPARITEGVASQFILDMVLGAQTRGERDELGGANGYHSKQHDLHTGEKFVSLQCVTTTHLSDHKVLTTYI